MISLKQSERKQNTIAQEIAYSGIGLHTGEQVSIKLCPAGENSGIFFQRMDLPGKPVIPAHLDYVCDTSDRSTVLGLDKLRIHTVEHLLAALYATEIDNLRIEITSIEPPVGNGSSDVFMDLIEKAGVSRQSAFARSLAVDRPVYYSENEIHIVALPYPGYKISYTLNYPDCPQLKSQYRSFDITKEVFKNEIAPCRTFCRYDEISLLMDRGLIKGGSLDNAVVIKDNAIFSKEGLFFPDEPVRHKILDMVGDIALTGFQIQAHIIAIRSGHAANYNFAKKILDSIIKENS